MFSQKRPIEGEAWIGNIDRAVTLIGEKESFLFCGDIDPDSVGSMISLALFVRLMDKQASIVLTNGLSENLDYLISILNHNSIRILKTEAEVKNLRKNVGALIICDTANTKLIPFYSVLLENFIARNLQVIEIDHHFGADSEEVTKDGIKLFRQANATTEIIGELLQNLTKKFPETTDPFSQRNILIGLITGLLGDTVGGKVIPFKKDFDYWMKEWGKRLTQNTRWRKAKDDRPGDSKDSKFENPGNIREYLDHLSSEQEECLGALTNRIDNQNGLGVLNLMNPAYRELEKICQPHNSDRFMDILGFLLNRVPEEAGKIGVVCYNGKNAENKDCIFIKLRRAIDYDEFDLRKVENYIKSAFEGYYMGGGGHPSAVSFRVVPCTKGNFISQFKPVVDFIKANMK
jgi:hypothetical protein